MKDENYTDMNGEPITLEVLCRHEPEWAASRIRAELEKVERLKAENERLQAENDLLTWARKRGATSHDLSTGPVDKRKVASCVVHHYDGRKPTRVTTAGHGSDGEALAALRAKVEETT